MISVASISYLASPHGLSDLGAISAAEIWLFEQSRNSGAVVAVTCAQPSVPD